MSALQISQTDLNFANNLSENTDSQDQITDALEMMSQSSNEFYWLIMDQADECARSAGEYGTVEYLAELERFSHTLNHFLLCIWSMNEGKLPFVHPHDYKNRLATMGRENYQLQQIFQLLSTVDQDPQKSPSFHFMTTLVEKMQGMSEYTKNHLLLILRVVLEAAIWQNCPH